MEEQQKPEIGPRQTVDIVMLPGHGRGQLVWSNGPTFFIPDSGAPVVHLFKVDHGGASSEPRRSWQRVWHEGNGAFVEADVIERGKTHRRWYSPLFGDGWMCSWSERAGERSQHFERFDDLEGNHKLTFEMHEICVGRPAYREKMHRKSSKMPLIDDPDEMNWTTFKSADGSIFTFRRGGPPPPPGTFIPMVRDVDLLTPKARKAYDLAKKAHEEGSAPPVSPNQLTLPMGSER